MAEAARVYAQQMKLGQEAQNYATEIKLRAERKAGEILKETELNEGGRPKNNPSHDGRGFPKLSDFGFDYHDSSRLQSIASIPEEIFEKHIQETKENQEELNLSHDGTGLPNLSENQIRHQVVFDFYMLRLSCSHQKE